MTQRTKYLHTVNDESTLAVAIVSGADRKERRCRIVVEVGVTTQLRKDRVACHVNARYRKRVVEGARLPRSIIRRNGRMR